MSATQLAAIPTDSYFRFALAARRSDALPIDGALDVQSKPSASLKATTTGPRILDLPPSAALPFPGALSGEPPWAEVRAAWNPQGLGFAFRVPYEPPAKPARSRQSAARAPTVNSLGLWIDTRDTRDIHRASRFCQFYVIRIPSKTSRLNEFELTQMKIPRAMRDAPIARSPNVGRWIERRDDGVDCELWFPAETLNGFDPESNRRLGLMYAVTLRRFGVQYAALDGSFPVDSDPSLWMTLELSDDPV